MLQIEGMAVESSSGSIIEDSLIRDIMNETSDLGHKLLASFVVGRAVTLTLKQGGRQANLKQCIDMQRFYSF